MEFETQRRESWQNISHPRSVYFVIFSDEIYISFVYFLRNSDGCTLSVIFVILWIQFSGISKKLAKFVYLTLLCFKIIVI